MTEIPSGIVRTITTLRITLSATKEINEKQLRSLSSGLFLRKLWENDLIRFHRYEFENYTQDWDLSVEIPEHGEHYEKKDGSEWLTPDQVKDRISKDLGALQNRVHEFNQVKNYVDIMDR